MDVKTKVIVRKIYIHGKKEKDLEKKPCEEDNYDWVDLEYLNSMYKNWGGV